MSNEPRVVAVSGATAGQEWALGRGVVDLGRGDECALHLQDGAASRRHAQLQWDGDTLTLRDFGSTNRTYVNGHAVSEIDLRSGDVIRIGETQLRIHLPEREPEFAAVSGGDKTRRPRLGMLLGVAAIALIGGTFLMLALRPQAPVSGRELAERERVAAENSPLSASAARGARALSPAARRSFEEGRTLALYGRLAEARDALQRSLRQEPESPAAAALLREVEERIDERIDVLLRRARTALDERLAIRGRGAIQEAEHLMQADDPRMQEAGQLTTALDALEQD
jgi:hypothetical protein